MISSNNSSEKSCNGANPAMPALRNKTSSLPWSLARRTNKELVSSLRAVSAISTSTPLPNSSRACATLSAFLPVTMTRAPSSRKSFAVANPMPVVEAGRIQRAVDVQARDPPRIAPQDEAAGLPADRLDQSCVRQLAEDPADDHGVRPHTEGDVLRAKDLRGAEGEHGEGVQADGQPAVGC